VTIRSCQALLRRARRFKRTLNEARDAHGPERAHQRYPDFPKPGILFYDISTLLRDADACRWPWAEWRARFGRICRICWPESRAEAS